jgi:amino-acid N-acetyltransferase
MSEIAIRPARAEEEVIIKALIRREHLDPFNVHWENFLIAEEGGNIAGVAQVKPYHSGRELGSLVVVPARRQKGVGGALIKALIARESGSLLLFCVVFREPYYAKFGFRRAGWRDLKGELRIKYVMGRLFTSLFGRRLIVMRRLPSSS